jgi:hypothetical protein
VTGTAAGPLAPPRPAWWALSVPRHALLLAAVFGLGTVLNAAAYRSFLPLVVTGGLFLLVYPALFLRGIGGRYERRMFASVYAVSWMMAGVAAIYAEWLADPSQLSADAATFYELAAQASDFSLQEIRLVTVGYGAVALWQKIYNLADGLGMERGRYVGIAVNVLAVALAGTVTLRAARHLYGDDRTRLLRLIVLFSLCGLFWLFAGIHLRDAVVLLGLATLVMFWARYFAYQRTSDLVLLTVATLLGFAFFGYLRNIFIWVPFAMVLCGVAAILMFERVRGWRAVGVYGTAMLALVSMVVAVTLSLDVILMQLVRGYTMYLEFGLATQDADSLGNRFITTAPIPLRLLLGSIYLFIFPIPFWGGMALGSAYDLFKSLNAVFFYFFAPMFAYALWYQLRDRRARSAGVMFLAFVSIGFTAAIAGTSLETRHFGVFLPPMMLLAISPPLDDPRVRAATWRLTWLFLAAMAAIHAAWAALKLL